MTLVLLTADSPVWDGPVVCMCVCVGGVGVGGSYYRGRVPRRVSVRRILHTATLPVWPRTITLFRLCPLCTYRLIFQVTRRLME